MVPIKTWLAVLCLAGVLFAGGAIWMSHALGARWRQGFAAGEAAMAARQQRIIEANRFAANAAAEKSRQHARELEQHRERLQKKIIALEVAIGQASGGDTTCLDAGLLRSLSRTGSDRRNDSASPGGAD
ncbi:MAG: hypothetical protein KDJ29_14815 [Hyphomicrobiales bacterium]|nr:hypothetical protein [Hyphomicrobiales bacterium]